MKIYKKVELQQKGEVPDLYFKNSEKAELTDGLFLTFTTFNVYAARSSLQLTPLEGWMSHTTEAYRLSDAGRDMTIIFAEECAINDIKNRPGVTLQELLMYLEEEVKIRIKKNTSGFSESWIRKRVEVIRILKLLFNIV